MTNDETRWRGSPDAEIADLRAELDRARAERDDLAEQLRGAELEIEQIKGSIYAEGIPGGRPRFRKLIGRVQRLDDNPPEEPKDGDTWADSDGITWTYVADVGWLVSDIDLRDVAHRQRLARIEKELRE
jgi:hypothetical protein